MHFLSILAIVKNEDDYIKEFIEYYILNGVDHFYFYDNESDVPLHETLKEYAAICTIHPIIGIGKQLEAYNAFLKTHRNETKWVAAFDIDEYAFPKKHKTLRDFVKDLSGQGADCIGINWMIFGNGGHIKKPQSKLLIENYLYSQGTQHKNIKSISKTNAIKKFRHTHFPTLKCFKKALNAKGNKVKGAENVEETTDIIQINHYYTKSLEEFHDKVYKKELSDTGTIRAEDPETMKWILSEPERCSVYFDDGIVKKFSKEMSNRMEESNSF